MRESNRVAIRILWMALILVVGLGLAGSAALAGNPGDSRVVHGGTGLQPGAIGAQNGPETSLNDAYISLVPEGSAPPNGGTVAAGQRFVLDVMVNAGSHPDLAAQASYMTF